ncbi:X-X-X-Leu-X-X-Gly heptad repeat-containing protein [Gracilibacillus halophilus YIM-C55.5]|uniref:X-X-X-Leu-X-X-Gly heptad repeat-containing protein n=1 Tax=Gracilibacillus halophilus YIM-C55.5 TaxID=1308866 RepID=N4W9H1_9BACI|nr:X-X-X-Leu-X-X-Gly heptad repeat-containing protein [Gracilibacillus halophilus]ENH95904.1 X-X-X-Leu-X-X-Gly heptad repeat-containing protein [Gracilibacillus halophilus YIM-C55.5]
MKMKRVLLLLLVSILLIPPFPINAANDDATKTESDGSFSEKDEVVYATLSPSGEKNDMYVVNSFQVKDQGTIIDYGNYSSVKNLTDLTEINRNDNKIEFTATEDTFYYQGNIQEQPLPWEIDLTYKLDGKQMSPEQLLGNDGPFTLQMDTAKNGKADDVFFENYMLQVTLTLDAGKYQNIQAGDGTVANAGQNKQVTYTVMPGKEETLTLKADVSDFEMEAIEISAVPASMPVEDPDTDEMTNEMKSLTDATEEIDSGVNDLKQGIAELNNGAQKLQSGSADYQSGITELNSGTSELVNASKQINQSLTEMNQSLQNNHSKEMNVDELKKMASGLHEIASGLQETANSISNLNENYGDAYSQLDQAMQKIPDYQIESEDIQKLQQTDADQEVIDQLVETYKSARKAKQTYNTVTDAFDAVESTLTTVESSLKEMATSLETMANELGTALEQMTMTESMNQLQEGISKLSSNYKDFHAGLVDYTNGVSQLSSSYQELHNGINDVSDGTAELNNGAGELQQGTSELAESTSNLPDQMQDEIDEMMNQYDKSDFEPVSFVSSKNKKINNVQFVIKTQSITKDEEEKQETQQTEEKGFWDRLFDLFR